MKDTFKVPLMSKAKRNNPEDRRGETRGGEALIIQLAYRRAEWKKARYPLKNTGIEKLKSMPV